MKQFKKWLLTDEGQILVGDHRAEAAYRAALEWVLEELVVEESFEDFVQKLEKELNESD